jgi:hypothetical protein
VHIGSKGRRQTNLGNQIGAAMTRWECSPWSSWQHHWAARARRRENAPAHHGSGRGIREVNGAEEVLVAQGIGIGQLRGGGFGATARSVGSRGDARATAFARCASRNAASSVRPGGNARTGQHKYGVLGVGRDATMEPREHRLHASRGAVVLGVRPYRGAPCVVGRHPRDLPGVRRRPADGIPRHQHVHCGGDGAQC